MVTLALVFQWCDSVKLEGCRKAGTEKILLCTTKGVNEKSLKKHDNLSLRYEIARGRKTLKIAKHRR